MDETREPGGTPWVLDELAEAGVEATEAETRPAAVASEPELAHHPGPKQYVGIAVILAVVTALEVSLYYIHIVRVVFIAALLILAVVKFSLVVLWFMHLRFDSRIFQRLFLTGIVLALTVYLIVLTISRALPWEALVGMVLATAGLAVGWQLIRRRTQPSPSTEKEEAVRLAAQG